MNTKNILLAIATIFIFSACKEDYTFEDGLILPPAESDFYVSGTSFFNEMDTLSFDYQGGEQVFPDVDIDKTYGSASSIGEEDGKKFILSMVGDEARVYRNRVFEENDVSPINLIRGGLYIKMFSDRPASEIDRKFTKEELSDLIQAGETYSFGAEPGQVEIGFETRDLDDETRANLAWTFPAVKGTSDMLNDENIMEVISVEEYADPSAYLYARGFKVKVKFNVNLRNHLWIHSDIYLRDIEGVFFFEYE